MTEALDRVARFGAALREAGLPTGPGQMVDFSAAATLLEPGELYWAGRATLVTRPEEIPVYDRVFDAHFGGLPGEPPRRGQGMFERRVFTGDVPRAPRIEDVTGELPEVSVASADEVLRQKSFSRCNPDELAAIARLMRHIRFDIPPRTTRRRIRAAHGALDVRRTIRAALRTGGEPATRTWTERRTRPRKLVLLLDVSGSMADHSRALLMFAHAALRADSKVEAFCFGTRLTRLTRALAVGDPSVALARASVEALDWDGGTRIGASLKSFLDRYGHSGLARGAVVVICSDGLDVGDPELLGHQMRRLARLARRVVWLNPLKENAAYEPIARGMKAALPSIDLFVPGHNLESLEAMADELRHAARPAVRQAGVAAVRRLTDDGEPGS